MNHDEGLHPDFLAGAPAETLRFREAAFFPHAVLEPVLVPELCTALLEGFPTFDPEVARNEYGSVGPKAVREDFPALGEPYRRLDGIIRSPAFLERLSRISGIPDLLYDPDYVGGGTHENLNGAELETHVDFNLHPTRGWHRRLNLILFLNSEWDPSWGGALELHRDPWSPATDEIELIHPVFNRAVLFETSERSWHGFTPISIPRDRSDVSRRTVALYFYTRQRPVEEVAPAHATFYVMRPPPAGLEDREQVSREEVHALLAGIRRRDLQIRFLYDREKEFSATVDRLKARVDQLEEALRVQFPLRGPVRLTGTSRGWHHDGWVGPELRFRVEPERALVRMRVVGFCDPTRPGARRLSGQVGGHEFDVPIPPGSFDLAIDLPEALGAEAAIALIASPTWTPRVEGLGPDERELAFVLDHISFE